MHGKKGGHHHLGANTTVPTARVVAVTEKRAKSESVTQQTPKLKFAEKHVEPILKGQKTMTLRLDLDYQAFQIGRTFQLCHEDGERFASVPVHDRGYTTANMAADMNWDGHRNYRDVDELLEELREYYPDEELDEQTKLEIVYWDWEELWE